MNIKKLKEHVKLCKRNLKNKRVKVCAQCAFEDDIIMKYPELKVLFKEKRALIKKNSPEDFLVGDSY